MPQTAALPRTNRRRDALLEAATEEFLSAGYEGASLRNIVRQAGVSSDTLYRHFATKELLFRAVVAAKMESGFAHSMRITPAARPMEQVLEDIGYTYVRDFLSPASTAFYRMMVAESARIPGTTRDLWENGPLAAVRVLEDYFERQVAAGEVRIGDCRLAAFQFMDMIKGGLHLRTLLAGQPASDAEILASVSQAVRIFCRGIAPASP